MAGDQHPQQRLSPTLRITNYARSKPFNVRDRRGVRWCRCRWCGSSVQVGRMITRGSSLTVAFDQAPGVTAVNTPQFDECTSDRSVAS